MAEKEVVTIEKWELEHLCDEAVAIGNLRPEMLNEYVYTFKHRGKDVTDLTAISYQQIALEQGITTEEIKREDMEDGVFYQVTVAKYEPDIPKELWQRRYGVSFEPYKVNNRFDRFCYQKALTKATRNAIRQLVSANDKHRAINILQGLDIQPYEKQQAEVDVVSDEVPINTKETEAIEIYNLHSERLDSMGITKELFWGAVSHKYQVANRSQMTDEQWDDLIESITYVEPDENATPYAKWINDLVPF